MTQSESSGAFGDLSATPHSARIVVVLVEPRDPRNIGSVARAMSNLGVLELRLVAPARFDREIAQGVACWGEDIIKAAGTFTDLESAVEDVHEVVGFASDSGHHGIPQMLLSQWVDTRDIRPPSDVALVFGSEENGLRREHFPFCECLIRIPSTGENRSYNLAQAVLLTLYELRKASRFCVGAGSSELPTHAQVKPLTDMVLRLAEMSGFLRENAPEHIRDLLANLTRRGKMTRRELTIVTGFIGTVTKALERGSSTPLR